jgi:hypothetical protein
MRFEPIHRWLILSDELGWLRIVPLGYSLLRLFHAAEIAKPPTAFHARIFRRTDPAACLVVRSGWALPPTPPQPKELERLPSADGPDTKVGSAALASAPSVAAASASSAAPSTRTAAVAAATGGAASTSPSAAQSLPPPAVIFAPASLVFPAAPTRASLDVSAIKD